MWPHHSFAGYADHTRFRSVYASRIPVARKTIPPLFPAHAANALKIRMARETATSPPLPPPSGPGGNITVYTSVVHIILCMNRFVVDSVHNHQVAKSFLFALLLGYRACNICRFCRKHTARGKNRRDFC